MFTFSKKQLTLALMFLFALCETVRAEDYESSSNSDDDDLVRQGQRPVESKGRFKTKCSGLWKLCKKHKLTTFICFIAFVFALVALFAPMTWANKDAGKMIFGDQGASMWLRLAVALSCLTFSIGTLSVALCRAENRDQMDYNHEYIAHRHENKKNTKKLQYCLFGALLLIAIVVGVCGWFKNADNVMFHFAWILPTLAGACVLVWMHYDQKHITALHNQRYRQKQTAGLHFSDDDDLAKANSSKPEQKVQARTRKDVAMHDFVMEAINNDGGIRGAPTLTTNELDERPDQSARKTETCSGASEVRRRLKNILSSM